MSDVKIEMNNEEAELFKKFRQYKDIWEKAFKIKTGKVILHFGNWEIRKTEYIYQERVDNKKK